MVVVVDVGVGVDAVVVFDVSAYVGVDVAQLLF